jgi:putative membrane protein
MHEKRVQSTLTQPKPKIAKWLLAAGAWMFISGFFVARVPEATKPEYAAASSIFVVLFAIPSYVALWRWVGAALALKVLLMLGLFAIGIESLAVVTGWPYGQFYYGDKIGAKVLGLVPWTVPFAWTPLVLGCFTLAQRYIRPRASTFILATSLLLVAADLVLDPGATRQGFWIWPQGGVYYGVPLSNFVGWLLSGAVGGAILWHFLRLHVERGEVPPRELMSSLFLTLAFWTSVCTWTPLPVAAAIGYFLSAIMICHLFLVPATASQESRVAALETN